MRIALFLWILFLGTLTGNAQIKERVVVEGEKGQALPGVNIYMQNDSIVFSHVGYHTFKCTLRELKQLNYRVTLHEQPQRMQEVVVSGKSRSPFLEWTEVASLPKPLYSFGGFLLDGKIYVIAGDETLVRLVATKTRTGTEANEYHSSTIYVYDIATDVWKKHTDGLVPRAGHSAHFYKNKIFILGGKRFSTNRKLEYTDATMEIYDLNKDTLYIDPVNPHQAVDFTSFIYEDCLYVMGGAVKEKVFSDKIHTLDLKRGVWYELEDTIPAGRCGRMNGIRVGNKVYFFGGYRTAPLWTAASYDLQTRQWRRLCNLKEGVAYPGLAAHGDCIYIFENRNLQVYNIKTDTIRMYELAALNKENAGLFYWNNTLYIVGGCTRQGIYVAPHKRVIAVDVSRISSQ